MSRIRSIKPEFWTSAQVLECSTNARLLFVGLWNFCDDHGRHPYNAKQAKAEVFPADPFAEEHILAMLEELWSNGLIERYTHDGKEYFVVTGWRHQRIDKRQEPKYPDPFHEHSAIILRMLPPDRIGKERKGEEGKGKDSAEGKNGSAPKGAALKLKLPEGNPLAAQKAVEAELFVVGKKILGTRASGLIKKLIQAKNGNVALARAAIETASTKGDPREYIGAIVRGRDRDDEAARRARGDCF